MLNDINTLTTLQRERYDGFVREAAIRRLFRQQKSVEKSRQPAGKHSASANGAPSFYELFLRALQARIRTVRLS